MLITFSRILGSSIWVAGVHCFYGTWKSCQAHGVNVILTLSNLPELFDLVFPAFHQHHQCDHDDPDLVNVRPPALLQPTLIVIVIVMAHDVVIVIVIVIVRPPSLLQPAVMRPRRHLVGRRMADSNCQHKHVHLRGKHKDTKTNKKTHIKGQSMRNQDKSSTISDCTGVHPDGARVLEEDAGDHWVGQLGHSGRGGIKIYVIFNHLPEEIGI